jgi:hypothetical protein
VARACPAAGRWALAAAIVAVAPLGGCESSSTRRLAPTSSGAHCAVLVSTAPYEPVYHVEGAVRVPAGCTLELDGDVNVNEGGSLTLEPGVTLRFRAGKMLWVKGSLAASGTAAKPVTLTAAEDTWEGLVLAGNGPAPSTLEHVAVSLAGPRRSQSWSKGGVTVLRSARLSMTDSVIERSVGPGLVVDGDQAGFSRFERNALRDNAGFSLHAPAAALGSVGANTFGQPIRVRGVLSSSQKWPSFGVPLVFDETFKIEAGPGAAAPAVLELAEGTALRFAADASLRVGTWGRGALIARRATFTSAKPTPAAGDWQGVEFGEGAGGTSLADCAVEYAGRSVSRGGRSPGAAVTFASDKAAAAVALRGLTVRHTEARATALRSASGPLDCAALAGAGNRSLDVPLCAK